MKTAKKYSEISTNGRSEVLQPKDNAQTKYDAEYAKILIAKTWWNYTANTYIQDLHCTCQVHIGTHLGRGGAVRFRCENHVPLLKKQQINVTSMM